MAFQIPKADTIAKIIANSRPSTPLDLSTVTDADGKAVSQTEAKSQIEQIIGDAGPLPAMQFPLFEELIVGIEALETAARINTIVRDGVAAGQLLEVRLYGSESGDRYEAVRNLKDKLRVWMPILSHPVFELGKASLSDRIDKELKGRPGRTKGGAYLQLAWSFSFVAHAELFEYSQKKTKDQGQGQGQGQPQPQAEAQSQDLANIEV
jgi:hypothetical protein